MKQTIKKYQKSSLTLISVALLSVTTFSQAQEWNDSSIKLCGKFKSILNEEALLNAGYSLSSIEAMKEGIREDLKQQAYVYISSSNVSFSLEPRYLTDEVSIINTNPNNPINISDRSAKINGPDDFYVLSNLFIRSLDLDPDQILTGKTTISGPGVHYVNEATVRLGDLPVNQVAYRPSCKTSYL